MSLQSLGNVVHSLFESFQSLLLALVYHIVRNPHPIRNDAADLLHSLASVPNDFTHSSADSLRVFLPAVLAGL
jgi:uncharacterized membrane protein YhfC